MKTTEQKFEQAKRLSAILANVKDPINHERTKRYYFVLGIFQETRKKLNKEYELIRLSKVKDKEVVTESSKLEEKRAIKEANVTSSTYERAKNRLEKQVSGWLTGSR